MQENGTTTTTSGYTTATIGDDPNINFSTWNFDLSYSWQFAPGSFVTALYRNRLYNEDDAAKNEYFESIDALFDQSINHTISIKLQYFLDYNQIPALFRKKGKPQQTI